jgi:CheY-like chemotaxis protein
MSEQKPQILLADDEATFRETFTKVLEEEGFAVTAVRDGKGATDAIMKQPYAVAVLDIQMPGSDGLRPASSWSPPTEPSKWPSKPSSLAPATT